MTNENPATEALFAALDATWSELRQLLGSPDQKTYNTIPFEDSWTVAQLATHIVLSNKGMISTMQMPGIEADRDPGLGAGKMKKIFLDFDARYPAPDFIIPELKTYSKESVLDALDASVRKLADLRYRVALSEQLKVPIFGDVTRLELYYFVLYHTQRHIHQLKKILAALDVPEHVND